MDLSLIKLVYWTSFCSVQATSAGIVISVEFDLLEYGLHYQSDVLVLGDESEIMQSLEYLLRGAVKVSKTETTVQLRVSLDRSKRVEIKSEENGFFCFGFNSLNHTADGAAGHTRTDNAAADFRSLGVLSVGIVDTGPGGRQVRENIVRLCSRHSSTWVQGL